MDRHYESDEVYLNVGNGGFTFQVVDEGSGPVILVGSVFGGHPAMLRIITDRVSLSDLAKLFQVASDRDGPYTENYCDRASVEHQDRSIVDTWRRLESERLSPVEQPDAGP